MKNQFAILLLALPLALFAQEATAPNDSSQAGATGISQEERIKALEEQIDQLSRDQAAQEKKNLTQKFHWGNNWGLELGTGMQGNFTYWEGGVITPKLWDIFSLSVKGAYVNHIDWPSFMQWSAQASLRLTASTPLLFNFTRIYGGGEFLYNHQDYTLDSYYDPLAYFRSDNLAWFVFGGIEAYASSWFAVFAEVGRGSSLGMWGSGTLGGSDAHPTPHIQSDFYGMFLKCGLRLYLPTND